MIKYETLPTFPLQTKHVSIRSLTQSPELVHLEDPAFAVMTDFCQSLPRSISADASMDDALHVMKSTGVHMLLVVDKEGAIKGIISSEDLLGEAPIKIIQERRIQRTMVLVKMLMLPIEKIPAFNIEDVEYARVGNVVNTLKELNQHYAFVVRIEENNAHIIRGLFNTSEISKLLHTDIENSIRKAQSVSELQKRHH